MIRRVSFRAALAGTVREATFEDRVHLVVPVVALVQGVIQASNADAPELVLAEEFSKVPQGWDGRPVMLDHPEDDAGGKVSANSPQVLERWKVGTVFNTAVAKDKLTMEAWLDVEKMRAMGGEAARLEERVRNAEPVEVSVGVFVDSQPAVGQLDGVRYASVWRDLVPDHLAMLHEGATGACSVEMGCGAPRAAEGDMKLKGAGSVPKNPPGDKKAPRDEAWSAPALKDFTDKSWGDLTDAERSKIATHFAWAAELPPAAFGDLKLPHHRASDGAAVFRGVSAALGRLDQADIPSGDKDKVRAHLEAHQREFDKQKNASSAFDRIRERFAALMAKIHLAQDPNQDNPEEDPGNSDMDTRYALEQALFATEPGFLGVVEVFPDARQVIYAVAPEGEVKFFRRTYELAGDGTLKLDGTAEEVKQVTRYEPVTATAPATAASCGCGGKGKTTPAPMEATMKEKKDRVAAIIASGKTCFTAASAAVLEQLPDAELKALEDEVGKPADPPAETPPPPETPPADPPPAPTPEQEQAAFLAKHPDIAAIVTEHKAASARKREGLVTTLTSAQKTYSEAELKAMSTPQLEKLAQLVTGKEPSVDHSLNNPPRAAEDGDIPAPVDMTARIRSARERKTA